MNSLRWDRVQALFHEAAECHPSEWQPFLERQCPGEPELVAEVLALLEEDAQTGEALISSTHATARILCATARQAL
jgi:hypothetical protein